MLYICVDKKFNMDLIFSVSEATSEHYLSTATDLYANNRVAVVHYSEKPCSEIELDFNNTYNAEFSSTVEILLNSIRNNNSIVFAPIQEHTLFGFYTSTKSVEIYVGDNGSYFTNSFDSYIKNHPNYFFILHNIKILRKKNKHEGFYFSLLLEKLDRAYLSFDALVRKYYINQIIVDL